MSSWGAVLIVTAAVVLTYVFCVRPMRRGKSSSCAGTSATSAEVAELRKELAQLREQRDQGA